MYELGIRHALSLPVVMMAWHDQRLPFDIGNQRVIMEGRDLLDLETNKEKLVSFIRAAEKGHFYRPMEAVGRSATLEAASSALDRDSVLRALVQEVRDLRASLHESQTPRLPRWSYVEVTPKVGTTLKRLLGSKETRRPLHRVFLDAGGTLREWSILLDSTPSQQLVEISKDWPQQQWEKFIAAQAQQFREEEQRQTRLGFSDVVKEGA